MSIAGYFAQFILLSIIPLALILYATRGLKMGALILLFSVWLYGPNIGYLLPGLPDYTKGFALSISLCLGIAMFSQGRPKVFRPTWCDIPMAVFLVSPFFTSLSNDLGVHDGFSSLLSNLVWWGIPYYFGRLYLGDRQGMKDLARVFAISALGYIPLCLWEIRMSPQLHGILYGVMAWNYDAPRYGLGYRPVVFMANGLECGFVLAMASLVSYLLWSSRAIRSLWGFSYSGFLLALIGTTILGKSTSAILLMFTGIATFLLSRRFGKLLFVWVLMLLPLAYMGSRVWGGWKGDELVRMARTYLNDVRAQSLEFRLQNEDLLMARAMERPLLGWGGWNRNRVFNKSGKDLTVTDGFWIIQMGSYGLISLSAYTALIILVTWRLFRRVPARTWSTGDDVPAVGFALVLLLYAIDNLSNAYIGHFYGLVLGGLVSYVPAWPNRAPSVATTILDRVASLAEAGDLESAEALCNEVIVQGTAAPDVPEAAFAVAGAYQARAGVLAATGRADDAIESLHAASAHWGQQAAAHANDPTVLANLAQARESLARLLASQGKSADALGAWLDAVGLRERLAADASGRATLASTLNDAAWFLTFGPDILHRDPALAIGMAERAVALRPDVASHWNTLGAAYSQANNPLDALRALGRSMASSQATNPLDHYLVSLSQAQLGNYSEAQRSYALAENLIRPQQLEDPVVAEVRAEAAARCHSHAAIAKEYG